MRKLKLRNPFALLLLLPALHLIAGEAGAQSAYKIDETAYLRCDLSEVPQVTDSPSPIFVALNANAEARAALIVYGMPGWSLRYAKSVRRWLSQVRGIAPERLIALYGGPVETPRMELWLVPRGAALPELKSSLDDKQATLFDRYVYWRGDYCGSGRPPSLAEFAEALKRRPGWRGYIVSPAQKQSQRAGRDRFLGLGWIPFPPGGIAPRRRRQALSD
ncbi:MAG TPA: hypothetical protein VF723_01565 [Pyrinomonadaceae bacterium]|jgi:hypothetical protein